MVSVVYVPYAIIYMNWTEEGEMGCQLTNFQRVLSAHEASGGELLASKSRCEGHFRFILDDSFEGTFSIRPNRYRKLASSMYVVSGRNEEYICGMLCRWRRG